MKSFERLGAFYLGRMSGVDGAPFLYDSKDLTTHGLIVGMTGSGKTGLGVVLLEEAALDGIPALVIDPKGDMGNLMLRFPDLSAEEFAPWVDASEATRAGVDKEQHARDTAEKWRNGIAAWGQSKARLKALQKGADVRVYTPGSASGRPIALLRAFDAPPRPVREDEDALRERVSSSVSGLLGLVGIDADPVTSREHILMANLLERAWTAGEDRDIESLVAEIQEPPFEKLGVMALESFFPSKDRTTLAMKLNNLLASPAFSAWRAGEPLDIEKLLYSDTGKPRVAVLSIAHLSDEERMFFVTLLLTEVISWMRSLDGSGSLRAILYMDEIFGYFPPVKAPPSKAPMLTLLKQARAYGLGVLLSTQNPVDLDYKGLGNTGTWFLGRLQTARDRERLLDGLSSVSGETTFDRQQAQELLGSMDKRVFLVRNVHEETPVLVHTRWALSYLRGPLTLQQLKELIGPAEASVLPAVAPMKKQLEPAGEEDERPSVPDTVEECFIDSGLPGLGTYEPYLLATVGVHYVRVGYGVDHFETLQFLVPLEEGGPEWDEGDELAPVSTTAEPRAGSRFASLPKPAQRDKSYARWGKSFLQFLYRDRPLTLYHCKSVRSYSRPHESEASFRVRATHAVHEKRDAAIEKLRERYSVKLDKLELAVARAQSRLERESGQYSAQKARTAISIGETLLGALFGRKRLSSANVGRASRTARSATRASRERDDVAHARKQMQAQKSKLRELSAELTKKIEALRADVGTGTLVLTEHSLRLRKSDSTLERFALAWKVRER